MAASSVPTAQMPTSASTTPRIAAAPSGEKKSANAGSATSSAAARNARVASGLAEPDRAAVARREHEPVERAALALRRPRARQAEQRREDERDPEQPLCRDLVGPGREREVEDDERRDDEEQHRGQRVPRPQLEPEVLARERADVGEVAHASARRAVASGSTRAGSCVVRRMVVVPASAASSRSSSAAPSVVERRERLVEHEQLGIVQERAAEREPLRHAARVRRDTRSARASQRPKRSSSIPIRSRRSGHAVEAPVELEVLERGQLPVDERLVTEEAELATGDFDLELPSRRRGETGDETQQRRLARPVRTGDDEEAAALEVEVERPQRAPVPVPPLDCPRGPDHRLSRRRRRGARSRRRRC